MPPETETPTDKPMVMRNEQGEIIPPDSVKEQVKEQTKPEQTIETTGTDKKDEKDKSLLNQDDKKEEKKPGAEGVPEKYEYKLPEGIELDETVITEANSVFKELGLSQPAAQRLVDFHIKTIQAAQDRPFEVWKEHQETMQNELKNDPEIGGKLSQVKTTISKAIDQFAGAELGQKFKEFMDLSGAGNNVHFAKVLYKLAEALSEGGHVSGRGPSAEGQKSPGAAPASAAHALFPNLR